MWLFCLVFFFRQKTAYKMRISDWSSDVCSSDLTRILRPDRMLDPDLRGVGVGHLVDVVVHLDRFGLGPRAEVRVGVDHPWGHPLAARIAGSIAVRHRERGADGADLAVLHHNRPVCDLLAGRGHAPPAAQADPAPGEGS